MTNRAEEHGSQALTPTNLEKINNSLEEVQGFLVFVEDFFSLMGDAECDTFSRPACRHVNQSASAAYCTLDEIHDRVNGKPAEVEGTDVPSDRR